MTDEDDVSVDVSVNVSVADADASDDATGERAPAARAPRSEATDSDPEPVEEGRRAPDRGSEMPDERVRADVERRERAHVRDRDDPDLDAASRRPRAEDVGRRDDADADRGLERLSDDPDAGGRAAETETEDGGADAASRPQARFEVYEDRAGRWRWRLKHRNGNVLADSGQGYASRANAERGLASVRRNAPDASVERLSSAEREDSGADGADDETRDASGDASDG